MAAAMAAIRTGDVAFLRQLLDAEPELVHAEAGAGGSLLALPARDLPQEVLDEALVHAAQNERPAAVAWLLEHDADPDACPHQGCGALHLAAAFGALECVRLMIVAGADIDRTNDLNGDNALG